MGLFGFGKKKEETYTLPKKEVEDLIEERDNLKKTAGTDLELEEIREAAKINQVLDTLKEGTRTQDELKMKMKIFSEGGVKKHVERETEIANLRAMKEKMDAAKAGFEMAKGIDGSTVANAEKVLDIYERGLTIADKRK